MGGPRPSMAVVPKDVKTVAALLLANGKITQEQHDVLMAEFRRDYVEISPGVFAQVPKPVVRRPEVGSPEHNAATQDDCPACGESLDTLRSEGKEIYKGACGHSMCKDDYDRWKATSQGRPTTCPLCRLEGYGYKRCNKCGLKK